MSLNSVALRSVAAIALVCLAGAANAWPASVVRIADGDTVTVRRLSDDKIFRVRLADIDAPEVGHGSNRPGQPYGEVATKAIKKIIGTNSVDVQPDGSRSWDRIVATIFVDGSDVAMTMVRSGYAWRSPKYDTDHVYDDAQEQARASRRGLWKQKTPIPPWEWRSSRW